MYLIAIPWYVIFLALAVVVSATAYLIYRLSLHNSLMRRACGVRDTPRWGGDALSAIGTPTRTSNRQSGADYFILGAAGHDLADPHNATSLYDNPAGGLQD